MPRYFTRARTPLEDGEELEFWDDPEIVNDVQVCDHEATDTGLLDSNGDAIWRAPNPMGFGKDEEW